MAKKSKEFSELLHQQRMDKAQQRGLEKLQKKLQEGPLGDKFAGLVMNPKGEVKMSEVLEAFIEPYLGSAQNHSQQEKLLEIAVIAWNLAIMPESDRLSMLDQIIKEGLENKDSLAQQEAREIIDEMIARKQKFFANNKRYIIDFQFQDTGKQFHLSVASTLSNPFAVG